MRTRRDAPTFLTGGHHITYDHQPQNLGLNQMSTDSKKSGTPIDLLFYIENKGETLPLFPSTSG